MALRAELYCYFCGHGCGEVVVATNARRPTPEQLRVSYDALARADGPIWDQGGQPLCPRCHGQLFLERYEHEVVRRGDRRLKAG